MGNMSAVAKANYILAKYEIKADIMRHKGINIGLSILDYFCDEPKKDIVYKHLNHSEKRRKEILESLIIQKEVAQHDIQYYTYFWIDFLKTTHKLKEPITIIGAQGAGCNDFSIFVHYGCAVVDSDFIRTYGLSGLEIIANATHEQDKETRKKRARMVFDYLKKIRWL